MNLRICCATLAALLTGTASMETGLNLRKSDADTRHTEVIVQEGVMMENYPIEEWASEIEEKLVLFEEEVQNSLQERYHRAFLITKLGADPNGRAVVLFMCPADDETLVFTAYVEQGAVIHEDYIGHLRLREYEQTLIKALNDTGYEAEVKAVVPDLDTSDTPMETSLSELLAREDVPGILVRIALRGPVQNPARITDALMASGLLCGTRAVFNGYVFDERGFAACREQFLSSPTVSDAIITSFEPTAEFSLAVENGACRIVSQRGIELAGR